MNTIYNFKQRCAFLIAVCCCQIALPQDPNTLAKSYIAARMEVWAGDLEVTYRRWSPNYEDKGSFFSKFDQTQGGNSFRHIVDGSEVSILENETHRWVMESDNPHVSKRSVDAEYMTRRSIPFDIKCIGLVNGGEWDRRLSFESMKKYLLGDTVKIEELTEGREVGMPVLRWTGPPDEDDQSYWTREVTLDQSRGLLPISIREGRGKMVEALNRDERNTDGLKEVVSVEHEATIDWSEFDGVWVPKKWTYQEFGGSQGAEYVFNWNSVNSAHEPELFSQGSLSLPKGTRIMNEMIEDQTFVEEIVGEGMTEIRATGGSKTFFVLANVVIAAALISLFVVKKRRAIQSGT